MTKDDRLRPRPLCSICGNVVSRKDAEMFGVKGTISIGHKGCIDDMGGDAVEATQDVGATYDL